MHMLKDADVTLSVQADHTYRENGKIKKADEMKEMCQKNGFIPVSMKNDWTTIYGEGVTKK
jgi:hypothetical protein